MTTNQTTKVPTTTTVITKTTRKETKEAEMTTAATKGRAATIATVTVRTARKNTLRFKTRGFTRTTPGPPKSSMSGGFHWPIVKVKNFSIMQISGCFRIRIFVYFIYFLSIFFFSIIINLKKKKIDDESDHRYVLIGRNGVGKTTLMKAISTGSLPGFPKHIRTLFVEQESNHCNHH